MSDQLLVWGMDQTWHIFVCWQGSWQGFAFWPWSLQFDVPGSLLNNLSVAAWQRTHMWPISKRCCASWESNGTEPCCNLDVTDQPSAHAILQFWSTPYWNDDSTWWLSWMVSYGHDFLKPTKVFGSWLGPSSYHDQGSWSNISIFVFTTLHACIHMCLAKAKGKNTEEKTETWRSEKS